MSHNKRHSRREARRAERRASRQGNKDSRRASRLERQKGRQGFMSGIIGDKGLGGLVEKFGMGGGDDVGAYKDDSSEMGKDNTMMYVAIAVGAYLLMNKKK